jgi:hypothetical protein
LLVGEPLEQRDVCAVDPKCGVGVRASGGDEANAHEDYSAISVSRSFEPAAILHEHLAEYDVDAHSILGEWHRAGCISAVLSLR